MSTTDHYAEAERLLGLARTTQEWVDDGHGGNHHMPEVIAAAQVHATLAFVQWQRRTDVKHTNMSALRDEQAARGVRMIPWPPSDDLVERVAGHLFDVDNPGGSWRAVTEADRDLYREDSRAVFDVIGGDSDA